MALRAGRLRHQIVIQRRSAGLDVVGQQVRTWETFATVRADFEFGANTEGFQSDQRTSEQRGTFTIRYIEGVTPQMRIVWRGQTWEIEGAGEVGHLEELKLQAVIREKPSGES